MLSLQNQNLSHKTSYFTTGKQVSGYLCFFFLFVVQKKYTASISEIARQGLQYKEQVMIMVSIIYFFLIVMEKLCYIYKSINFYIGYKVVKRFSDLFSFGREINLETIYLSEKGI